MEPIVIVEVLGRTGRVRERHRIASLPVTIGRAYTNNLILDDPYVSPCHVRVEQDETGALVATDLESTNGMHRLPADTRVVRTVLPHGQRLRVGRTTLRFQHPNRPVDDAMPDRPTGNGWWRVTSSTLGVAALVLITAALLIGERHLETFQRVSWLRLFSDTVPTLLWLLGWSGGWALASRVSRHRSQFRAHVGVASAAVISATVLGVAADYIAFASSSTLAEPAMRMVGGGLILTGLLYGHLRQCAHADRGRLIAVAAGVSCLLVLAIRIASLSTQDDFSSQPHFPEHLVTPRVTFLPDASTEEFFREARTLQTTLDHLAQDGLDAPTNASEPPIPP